MRKVLIITFLVLLNAMILLVPRAHSKEWDQRVDKSAFQCHGRTMLDHLVSYFIHSDDYLIVLSKSANYSDALYQREQLEKKISSVHILDDFDFTLQIVKWGQNFLVVDRSCYKKSEASANVRTLKFFFNISADSLCSNCQRPREIERRVPASIIKSEPIYLLKERHE